MEWTVSRRIILGYALALTLLAIVAGLGIFALRNVSQAYQTALNQQRGHEIPSYQAETAFQEANLDFLRYLLQPQDRWLVGRDSSVREARRLLARARRSSVDPGSWDEAADLLDRWDRDTQVALEALRAGRRDEALRIRDERVVPVRERLYAAIDRGLNRERTATEDVVQDADGLSGWMERLIWGGAAIALLLGIASALRLNRAVSRPLRETTSVLASSASEILAATRQQASGASQAMAAVAETAATVDEVAQTAEQAAQRARAVAESSQRTAEIGKTGRRAVEESTHAMTVVQGQVESIATRILALAEQAQAIGEIIATVDDISGQTNLLALNAAIEASRAGEYGRGFAVVASEIRSLAEQSRGATVQVRQILGEIQRATAAAVMTTEEGTKQAATGVRQVAEAGDTIRLLAETAGEVAQAATQIVASVGQQAAGMHQIRQAMHDIQSATQQNLSATQQTERAAQELSRMGESLLDLVGAGRGTAAG